MKNGVKILDFIGGRKKSFVIPPFQRNYRWEESECEELFEDIISLVNSSQDKEHYLGNIVYCHGDDTSASFQEYLLIDGQQRITSVLLLLCALRDSDLSLKDDINESYLLNRTQDKRFRIRLKQTLADADTFEQIVESSEITKKDSRVYENYQSFIEFIQKAHDDKGLSPKQIYDAIEKIVIVEIVLPYNSADNSTRNAVQICFEKINSAGTKLEPTDLIRNYLLFANSQKEQEERYKKYWLEIENNVLDTMERFFKDYLTIKFSQDFSAADLYKSFKLKFADSSKNKDTLNDILSYSKYYKFISNPTTKDERVNEFLQLLVLMRTEPTYPLITWLLKELLDTNIKELREALRIIVDFLIRYRIVNPSGGGGDLRKVIISLLSKLSSGAIQCDATSILFELSNSATEAGRFPTDDEFKKALMERNVFKYARVLFQRMERVEYKNIMADTNRITIEHLLPQTLTSWWKKSLGGEENAARISTQYLDVIGNLAPISGAYNSEMKNAPWDTKKTTLKDVQFKITSEIPEKYPIWNEESIIARNEDLASRAVSDITSPLKRTIPIAKTKKAEANYEEGVYPLSDVQTNLSHSNIISLNYDTTTVSIQRWRDLLPALSKILIGIDAAKFDEIVKLNKIHKSTKTKSPYPPNNRSPIITKDKEFVQVPLAISGTDYFCEACISCERARVYAKSLAEEFSLSDLFCIEIV